MLRRESNRINSARNCEEFALLLVRGFLLEQPATASPIRAAEGTMKLLQRNRAFRIKTL